MKIKDYLPIYRQSMNLAIPAILSQAGQVSVTLVDTMMVGHVGTVELAAAAFSSNISLFGLLLGIGICIGLTPVIGQAYGRADNEKVASWLKNGVVLHTLIAFAIVVLMASITPFLKYMGQSDEVVSKAIPFYLILTASLFPMLIFTSLRQFLEGVGNTKIAMYVTITSNIVNIILNYIFIFGKLGCPAMGINGSGLATFISRLIMPVMIVVIIRRNSIFAPLLQLAYRSKIQMRKMRHLLSIGLPIGAQIVIEVTAFSVGAIMMGWISKESLAAHQVAIGLASFTYMLSFGLSAATTIRISHLYGENRFLEIRRTIFASLHLVIAFMTTMGILFIVFRHQLPYLFSNDQSVIDIAAKLLVVAAFFQIFDGTQVVMLGALRGLADVRRPMMLAIFSYVVVSVPISYFCAFVLNMGEIGIWTGFLVGLGTASVLFFTRIRKILKSIHLSIS